MNKQLVMNIYTMPFFSNAGAPLNTFEKAFLTVKWLRCNLIYSVYITAGIFIIYCIINIIDDRKLFLSYQKT